MEGSREKVIFPVRRHNGKRVRLGVIRLRRSTFIQRFRAEEDGAVATEYALIAALISVIIAGAVSVTGSNTAALFGSVSSTVGNATPDGNAGGPPTRPNPGRGGDITRPGGDRGNRVP